MLARLAPQLEIRAGAARSALHRAWKPGDRVLPLAGLRGHRPAQAAPYHLRPRCDFEAPLLPCVHVHPPSWYLLVVDTIRDGLSIPKRYTVGIWQGGVRTALWSWGWCNCSGRDADAGTSGCRAPVTRRGPSSARRYAQSAKARAGTSRNESRWRSNISVWSSWATKLDTNVTAAYSQVYDGQRRYFPGRPFPRRITPVGFRGL